MKWARDRRPVSRTALLVLAVALAAAAITVLTGRHLERLKAERQAASAAADSVTVVAGALRKEIAAAESTATPDEHGRSAADAVTKGVSLATLTVARDSGRPVLEDAAGGIIVVARYRAGADPATVQDRRNALTGYQIVPLNLATILKPLLPAGGGFSVSGPDRRVLSVPAPPQSSAAAFTASLGPDVASDWSLTTWTTPSRTPGVAWLVSVLLVATGFAVAGWISLRQRESRRRQTELNGLQGTSATVASLATMAQHSLDLGEVLPALTTELSTVLGLRGLSVAAPGPLGERPIFVLGVPPDQGEPLHGHDVLPTGRSLALTLSRGGRTVARLRVTAGRDLDRHDLATLVAAGEVLASALANAEVFSQQADLISRMRTVDELKSVFLATASHELRTPVVALAGYAGLLHSTWDRLSAEEGRGYAERVDTIAQRLSSLVEDILDFSRLQSGNRSAAEASVLDLSETVAQVLDEQSEMAPEHQVVYLPSPGLRVSGTQHAVERVLMNLVGNAVKYSDPGRTIRVLTREFGGRAELVVEDEGIGIPADQREQVFSPFYRGAGDQVVRTRGAGLGLAIVTEFAASMGGQVRVDEADGGGARFVVSYPLVLSEPVPEADLDPGVTHVQA